MNIDNVKQVVKDKYNLDVLDMTKIKNVYKISGEEEDYCLKVINYNLSRFLFVIGAIKHLQNKKFKSTPTIIKNKDGGEYVQIGSYFAYLTPWINARECNYSNPLDVMAAASKLADLHKKSLGFIVDKKMEVRTGWFNWSRDFLKKKGDLLKFQDTILSKAQRTEFDNLYLESMEEELGRIDKTLGNLSNTKYLSKMVSEYKLKGFCHHDYAHHNVLIEESGDINIIDFDYCLLDTHLHDLSSLIIRVMKNGKWDVDNVKLILDSYNGVYALDNDDIPIMAALIEFPQAYWQLGIQYYEEKQPWGEEFFINKLIKIYEDKDYRQDFVDEFKSISYK